MKGRSRLFALMGLTLCILAATLVIQPKTRGQDSARQLVRSTLGRAQAAGSYQIHMSLDQTVRQELVSYFGPQEEWAHFEIEGSMDGPDRARFAILPGRTSFVPAQQEAQEFLAVGSQVFHRAGDRWVAADPGTAVVEVDGIGLSLLSAARDVKHLDPAKGPPALGEHSPTYRRVGFKLHSDDVSRFLLVQQGITDPQAVALAKLSSPSIEGAGELWIDDAGLPARLVLDLEWVSGGSEPYRTHAASSTDYSSFGIEFPPNHFDPAASPATGALLPQSAPPWRVQPGLWLAMALAFLAFCWLLVRARTGSRRANVVVTVALVAGLLIPSLTPVAESAGLRQATTEGESPAPGSEFARMLEETATLASGYSPSSMSKASAIAEDQDDDGDGLPNRYELHLGTSPFAADSDYDGLTDREEVRGVHCPTATDPNFHIETDPLNPDSNYDGLKDGAEFYRGQCRQGLGGYEGYDYGYAWHDDNDLDGVPDGLDLSPFSTSMYGSHGWYGDDHAGPNLTFETLDQDPGDDLIPYPFYVEIQIRPKREESLRWAYKHVQWPGDNKGAIQSTPPLLRLLTEFTTGNQGNSTSGQLTLVPLLQAKLRESDLPSQKAMHHYGVSIAPHKDEQDQPVVENGEALYDMYMPLSPVERGGQIFAFQAKMLHDAGTSPSLSRHWRDLRFKWALLGDVRMLDSDTGQHVPSPDGNYGLVVYDEDYHLTGLQVSRQGGASMLVAAPLPYEPPQGEQYDDTRIALLRAGLEVHFLPGALDLLEIQTRFDATSSASDVERWHLEEDWFRVKYDETMDYEHLDEAIATTTMTTTVQLLDHEYAEYQSLEPTLVIASEQKTSTVNLDDDPTTDYMDITINSCIKPLITTRSLKLQTYRWGFGGDLDPEWEPLSLDEVLQKVEIEYEAITDPNYEYYNEELNIIKMATTAWQIGMTALQEIGQVKIQDLDKVLTDPETALELLNENDDLPRAYQEVIGVLLDIGKAGGPLAWLEAQWNKVVGVYDVGTGLVEAIGSFMDYSPETSPPSAKATISGSEEAPAEPGEPVDQTLLGWTETAINVLNFLATVTGWEWLGELVDILTKVVEVYGKIRALWDTTKAIVDNAGKVAQGAAQTMAQELSGLSKPLGLVGLVFAVAMIWLAVALQIGDAGPNIALTLVLRAVVETVLVIVLFVLAAAFPWGTVAAIVIGLSMALSNLTGVTLDPISALINWLFDVEVIVRTELPKDRVDLDPLDMESIEPGGGLLSGRQFKLSLHWSATMRTVNGGTAGDLNQSDAKLHIGRYTAAPWLPQSLCTPSEELFDAYLGALQGYIQEVEPPSQGGQCVNFIIPHEIGWLLTPDVGYPFGASPVPVPSGGYEREFQSTATLTVDPGAMINGQLLLDVSIDVTIVHDECSEIAGCDGSDSTFTTPPSIAPLYFDILPSTVYGVWHWAQLTNPDPDGDGLVGFIDPNTEQPTGPDGNLCPGTPGLLSWETWDRDYDGLSDKFEVEREGFDPCMADSDEDGLADGWELMVGTSPDDADTDDDGLSDREEVPIGQSVYGTDYTVDIPWRVQMQEPYPLLPAPAAFPSPRQQNLDGDHRKDSQEKAKLSSPNAYDALPVGEAVGLSINQAFTNGGGTAITVASSPWSNDEVAGVDATFTITLPVPFSDVAHSAMLFPPLILPGMDVGTLLASEPTYAQWSLPPMTLPRTLYATYSGLPDLPSQPVTVTAALRYTEASATRIVTATAPLLVNDGGPVTAFAGVVGAVQQDGGSSAPAGAARSTALTAEDGSTVTISGSATDPQGVSQVLLCVKATDTCEGGDWQPATLIAGIASGNWLYSFDSPGDGLYYVRAYAIDSFGLSGPVTEAMIIGIDHTPPLDVRLDLDGTAYLSTTLSAGPPGITLTGRITDTTGAPWVSGVDSLAVAIDVDELGTATVSERGEISSPFAFRWEPMVAGFGRSVRTATGVYTVTVGGSDVAGNVSPITDTLRVLVDDTPPMAYGRLPQVADSTSVALSGIADDTALVYDRQPSEPFSSTLTIADGDTQFEVGSGQGRALVVGDVTGDLIDDVVLLVPAVPGVAPFQAGLFFGRPWPDGFPDTLSIAAADVVFEGEAGVPELAPAAAGVGDVNGDGVDDLLLGDPNAASGVGRAYLILGRRGGGWSPAVSLADADWQLSVEGATGFGGSVASAGDVNGDGLADLLVGAAAIADQDGATWLFRGQEQDVPTGSTLFYSPSGADPLLLPSLAGLGDTNGDGLSDLLIASPGAPVALVYGQPDSTWLTSPPSPIPLDTDADALFSAFGPEQTVSAAGDLNGDSLGDILIGDPEAGTARVFVLYGRRPETAWPAGPTPIDEAMDASFVETDISGSRLGVGLTALGDVDWDGLNDFAFGQPGSSPGTDRTAIVLSGRLPMVPEMPVESATYIISGTATSQHSGEYLSGGDVTGDRIPDLLIGSAGDNPAYLFHGGYDPGAVAGIARVEIGLYGPVADATLPVTMTMPVAWVTAALANPGGALSPWNGTVTVPEDDDYPAYVRAYVRAYDRAGNQQKLEEQYLGNVWVNDTTAEIPAGSSASIDEPELTDKTSLTLAGSIDSTVPIQHLRVYNGYQWARLVPSAGPWSSDSTILRNDQRTLTFRVVARDGSGNTLHDARGLDVDNLVDRPQLVANLEVNQWYTDEYPELTITWPAVEDGNGIAGTWAVIDTISNSEPQPWDLVGINEVTGPLLDPAAYYGHVRVEDGVTNEHTVHTGPFLLNRSQTPSMILADGYLDLAGGEYPVGTLLNYDPYAALKPAALWGTWDAERLYLAYPWQTWGPESLLAVYLDTCDGGLESTLAPLGHAHALPFAADYAFVLGGPAGEYGSLYTAEPGSWTQIEAAGSFAAVRSGTEIVLDRSEIGAGDAVGLVAFAEDGRGVWAVLPGGARPATTELLTGTVTFGEALAWDSLEEGAIPGEGQDQVIAPAVTLNTAWDNVLFADQTTVFTMTIGNPDVAPYEQIPLTLRSSPDLVLNEVSGADCEPCPPGATEWTLYADVAAGGTQTVTVEAMSQGATLSGVFPLTVTASLANAGLPSEPQVASAQYSLDMGIGALSLLEEEEDEMFLAAPGKPEMTFIPDWSSIFHRCLQKVEANIGETVWTVVGDLGECTGISDELLAGETEVWQVRVAGENGQTSEPISRTVVADADPPTVQISPTVVLSGTLAFLRGSAWDDSPVVTRAPRRVEISVNGGRFYPAHLSPQLQATPDGDGGRQEPESTAKWLFPLWLTSQDGEAVEIVARAVDQAGNVGPETAPLPIILDNRGPIITAVQIDGWLEGTVSDGSEVASVSVSLDGGAHYQPVTPAGEAWSFELSSWTGSWPESFAMLRAVDLWGNVKHKLLPVAMEYNELYLPLVMKGGG